MKKIIIFIAYFLLIFGSVISSELSEIETTLLKSGNSGTDFWFSLPPSFTESAGVNKAKIIISSAFETEVEMEIADTQVKQSIVTKPNESVEFLVDLFAAEPFEHDGRFDKKREAAIYKGAGIHLYSEKPVIVYLISMNMSVTEGFSVLPTRKLGKEYITMAYNEPDMNLQGWFSPFTTITATENNTSVKFTMGGDESTNSAMPLTSGGMVEKGESTERILNQGDVWVLSINGKGQDLSGSIIESSKPVAVVSGVNCVQIPNNNTPCNYIVEMEFPISHWGTHHYVTSNKNKAFNGIVRVFSSEDSTIINRDNDVVDTINHKGEYLEFRLWDKYDNMSNPIRPDVATIHAEKPIAVMYYNTGSREDSDGGINIQDNPYMTQSIAADQYTNWAYVASPNVIGTPRPFVENDLLITFQSEDSKIPDDIVFAKLVTYSDEIEWTKLNSVPGIFDIFEIEKNGIQYGSKRINLSTEGNYIVKSDSHLFSVQSVSNGASYSPYGFPSGGSFSNYNSDYDISHPIINYSLNCEGNIIDGQVYDVNNSGNVTSELSNVFPFDLENYDFEIIKSEKDTLFWTLTKLDENLPASASLYFADSYVNDTVIEIYYEELITESTNSNELILNPNINSIQLRDTIRNSSNYSELWLTGLNYSNQNSGFKIDSISPKDWTTNQPIPINGEIIIYSTFENNELGDENTYKDSIMAGLGRIISGELVECQVKPSIIQSVTTNFPKYRIIDGNVIENVEDGDSKVKVSDVIRNLNKEQVLFVTDVKLKHGDKGFVIERFVPSTWSVGDSILPEKEIRVELIFDPAIVPQTKEKQIIIDSLGIEVSAYDDEGVLEAIAFTYLTEQRAEIKAKTESSIKYEESKYDILLEDGRLILYGEFYQKRVESIMLFDLEGNKVSSFSVNYDNMYNINGIASGTYLIAIEVNDITIVKRIVIIN